MSTTLEGLPAVMSALGAAVHQASLQQTLLLETLDAVQVCDMRGLHAWLSNCLRILQADPASGFLACYIEKRLHDGKACHVHEPCSGVHLHRRHAHTFHHCVYVYQLFKRAHTACKV